MTDSFCMVFQKKLPIVTPQNVISNWIRFLEIDT